MFEAFSEDARRVLFYARLAVSLLGGALGFLMPRPTPAQLDSLRAGRPTPVVGAHAVGVPDGGPAGLTQYVRASAHGRRARRIRMR